MALQFQHDPQGDQFFALRTFRKDGTAVATPIWLAPSNDCWYGYTPSRSWKITRIARTPDVQIASSTFHGEPLGDWRSGRARILPPSQLRVAKRALTAKYGNQFRLFTIVTFIGRWRKRGGRPVGLEITLDIAQQDTDERQPVPRATP